MATYHQGLGWSVAVFHTDGQGYTIPLTFAPQRVLLKFCMRLSRVIRSRRQKKHSAVCSAQLEVLFLILYYAR